MVNRLVILPDPFGDELDPEAFRKLSEEWKEWAEQYKWSLDNTTRGTTAGQWAARECAERIAGELWALSGWLEKDREVRSGK